MDAGDWLILARRSESDGDTDVVEDVEDGVGGWLDCGVLNAPVLCRCSFSKSSCSSLGRRGGEGPLPKGGRGGVLRWGVVVLKNAKAVVMGVRRWRWERWRGRRVRAVRCIVVGVGCTMRCVYVCKSE